jgi:DNA-directed RNA polymerase specialized sigma24 family protein
VSNANKILEQLSQKDGKWRSYALKITLDKDLADDLVQDMYLKCHRNQYKRTDDSYIYFILLNLYRDYLRKCNTLIDLDVIKERIGVEDDYGTDEVEDVITDKLKGFDDYFAELALINADGTSLREIERLYGVNYAKVWREIKIIKERLKQDQKIKETYYKNIR